MLSNVEQLPCINKTTCSFICLCISLNCHMEKYTFCCTLYITPFKSQGKGMIGGFDVNISLSQPNVKKHGVPVDAYESVRYAWLCLAEQRAVGLAVTGELLCLGFAFSFASAWVDSWGLLRLCCSHRYSVSRAPEKWTEDVEESACFLRTSEIYSHSMRLKMSSGLVAVLSLITCLSCAFHTDAAIDIPLEGECSLEWLSWTNLKKFV